MRKAALTAVLARLATVSKAAKVATLAILVSSMISCGGKKKAADNKPKDIDGLAALGVGVEIVVGGDVAKLADSRIVRRGVAAMLARDADLKARVDAIASECRLEPGENVDSFLIGMGKGPSDLLLVVTGRFEENALTACVQKRLADSGGRLTTKPMADRTAYRADGEAGSEPVWFALGSPRTLIVAGSEAWLLKGLGEGPRLTSDATFSALLTAAPTKHSVWATGRVPAEIGKGLAAATGNAVSAPVSMTAMLDFDSGIAAELRAEMKAENEAKSLAELHKIQAPMIAAMAQAKGLGKLASKLKVESDGRIVTLGLRADEQELSDLLAAVDTGAEDQQNPPSPEPEAVGEESKSHEGNTSPNGQAPLRR